MPAIPDLLSAGRILGAIAEPRDLAGFGSDLGDLGDTLRQIGSAAQRAYERAERTHDERRDALAARKLWNFVERREWTRAEVDAARDDELADARADALRKAQRALVDLAALVEALAQEEGR